MNEFGTRLRKERIRIKYTQEELGQVVGKSKNNISQYEHGKREPDQETLVELARLFMVSTDYLLGLTRCPSPSSPLANREFVGFERARRIDSRRVSGQVVMLPLFKEISCRRDLLGTPDDVYPVIADHFSDAYYFAMEAPDNSLAEQRIMRGDLLFARMQPGIDPGELAVICVGDTNAVLRYIEINEKPSGGAEEYILYTNKSMSNAQIVSHNDLRVLGRIVCVFFTPEHT